MVIAKSLDISSGWKRSNVTKYVFVLVIVKRLRLNCG